VVPGSLDAEMILTLLADDGAKAAEEPKK
jgi:hypothetical protein